MTSFPYIHRFRNNKTIGEHHEYNYGRPDFESWSSYAGGPNFGLRFLASWITTDLFVTRLCLNLSRSELSVPSLARRRGVPC